MDEQLITDCVTWLISEQYSFSLQLRSKKEKLHAAQQNAQSQKQLEDARKANIEKLVSWELNGWE